jgi:Fe-S cluster assembly iron-binding protein IscA
MIAITDDAKKELKKILTDNAENPNNSLRLTASEEGGLGLVMDAEMPGDSVFEYDGTKVLVIEGNLASNLEGISIEVEETPEGPMLTLKHSGCSCCGGGESTCGSEESSCGGGTCGEGCH